MLTLAMRRAVRDVSPASSTNVADDEDGGHTSAPVGDPPAYQQVSRLQRQARDPTAVSSTSTSASAVDNNSQLRQIVASAGSDEFVDILQVQQLLLENAGVSSDRSASVSVGGRGGVLGHTHRRALPDSQRLGLDSATRSRMLLQVHPPAVPTVATPSHGHHHCPPQPPPPPPPYYYANYMQQQQQQHYHQHQYQTSSVEDLFSLWLGSSGTGRSSWFFYF
jgi:hypothetical protein